MVVPKGYTGAAAYKDYSNLPIVSYSAKSNDTWSNSVINGTSVGTENSGRFNAMKIGLLNCSGGIKYAAHFSSSGWSDYVQDNAICTAENGYSSIEAVKMELYGDVVNNYNNSTVLMCVIKDGSDGQKTVRWRAQQVVHCLSHQFR